MQRPVLLPILLLLGCSSSAANTQAIWPPHLHYVCGCMCRLLATALPNEGDSQPSGLAQLACNHHLPQQHHFFPEAGLVGPVTYFAPVLV